MDMKRIIPLFFALALLVVVIGGCGNRTVNESGSADGAVKTGLAVMSSIAKSTDATAEKDGLAQVDSTVVAVTVDKDGKIVKCEIDAAQTAINLSTDGRIATPLDKAYRTKQELGTDYGMGALASGIKKEWNEQANAFADYVIGKTVAQVKGIAVNEGGAPNDSELSTSVTIHITDFTAAIEKAVNNAQDLGAKAGDKLGLGIVTTIGNSKDATADKEGVAQAYSSYAAVTFDSDGKITSSIIDASQSNVSFSTEGKITTDLASAVLKTKNELGDEYGMRKNSGIKKEWNEQAAAFAAYTVGKTVGEVKGVAVNEEGVPSDAELTSSVTVHVADFISVVEKASVNAR